MRLAADCHADGSLLLEFKGQVSPLPAISLALVGEAGSIYGKNAGLSIEVDAQSVVARREVGN